MPSEEARRLLVYAQANGGGLEERDLEWQESAVAECLQNLWLRWEHDEEQDPTRWLALTEEGERVVVGGRSDS